MLKAVSLHTDQPLNDYINFRAFKAMAESFSKGFCQSALRIPTAIAKARDRFGDEFSDDDEEMEAGVETSGADMTNAEKDVTGNEMCRESSIYDSF